MWCGVHGEVEEVNIDTHTELLFSKIVTLLKTGT